MNGKHGLLAIFVVIMLILEALGCHKTVEKIDSIFNRR